MQQWHLNPRVRTFLIGIAVVLGIQIESRLSPPRLDSYLSGNSIFIRTPVTSTHPCDLLYLRKIGSDNGYSLDCYLSNECRYVYVGNGQTTACSQLDEDVVNPGAAFEIPNVQTLVDGKYFAAFARWGFWDLMDSRGSYFTIEGGIVTSATGDPHITNIDGEKFDIFQTGNHTLLQIPRGITSLPDTAIRVEIFLMRRENATRAHQCKDTWITKLWITGTWLGINETLEFSAHGEQFNTITAMKMKVGNKPEAAPHIASQSLPPSIIKVIQPRFPVKKPSKLHEKKIYTEVKLYAGPIELKLFYAHSLGKWGPINHLDFTASRLHSTNLDVGGILGHDNHTYAASKPQECLVEAPKNPLQQ